MSVMLIDVDKAGQLIAGIRQFNQMFNTMSFIEGTDTGILNDEPLRKFIRKLYQANNETYNGRYNEDSFIIDILPATGKAFNKYQTLKTLQALHYNIETEYVPAATKLIEQLQTMIDEIKDRIIGESEGYQAAKWG